MRLLKTFILSITPDELLQWIISMKFKLRLIKVYYSHKIAIKKVKMKGKVKVAFFLIEPAAWKLEKVYNLMEKSERYEPIVVICPYIVHGKKVMINTLERAEKTMILKGHRYINTYNNKSNTWLNVKEVIKPDLVFFTVPWELTLPEYLIDNYLDVLTCYVPYPIPLDGIAWTSISDVV